MDVQPLNIVEFRGQLFIFGQHFFISGINPESLERKPTNDWTSDLDHGSCRFLTVANLSIDGLMETEFEDFL